MTTLELKNLLQSDEREIVLTGESKEALAVLSEGMFPSNPESAAHVRRHDKVYALKQTDGSRLYYTLPHGAQA